MTAFTSLSLSGPATNDVVNISSFKRENNFMCRRYRQFMERPEKSPCRSLFTKAISLPVIVTGTATDAMRSFIDPWNSSRFFISSWGSGLFEYENNTLVKHYDSSNSPLQISGTTGSGIKVCGLAMDKLKNLWITQTDVSGSVKDT